MPRASRVCFELVLLVEMVFDDGLVAAGDEDEMLDTGFARLIDGELDHRPVDDGQHFLGHGFGGGEETGPEPGHRENGLADARMGLTSIRPPLGERRTA